MRSVAEIAVGVLFAVGATFNAVYTLHHGEEFFGEFATKAWLRPAGRLVERVVLPRTTTFTTLLIAFQVGVAVAVLSRGALVTPALVAGGAFALIVALFSSRGGAVANLALSALQFALALTR